MNEPSALELTRNFLLLCGYFSYDDELLGFRGRGKLSTDFRPWYERGEPEAMRRYYGYLAGYYYPNYLSVAFPEAGGFLDGRSEPEGKAALRHLTLRRPLPGRANISVPGKPAQAIAVDWADLYLFPEEIGVFAIKTRLLGSTEEERPTMAALSDCLYLLRSEAACLETEGESLSITDYVHRRLMQSPGAGPAWRLYGGSENAGSRTFNSKLKTLLAVETEMDVSTEEGREAEDNLLFELGTGARLGTIRENGEFSPSRDYYRRIIEGNKISIFNNWSCLALFDTFTVLLNKPQASAFSTLDNFENVYLSIYVNAVFLKFSLYRLNTLIAGLEPSDRRNLAARDRFIRIKNLFSMSHVSNNFLPNEIHRRLAESLEIDAETTQLEEKIEKINDHIEERSSQVMNRFLAFMAFIAPFSAMWDLAEWLSKVFGIEGSYRFLSLAIFGVLFAAPLGVILRMSSRRRRSR